MATTKPTLVQDPSSEPPATPQPPPASAPVPSPVTLSAAKPDTPIAVAASDVREIARPALPPTAANLRPSEPSPTSDAVVAHVPSYARWFSFDDIHQCEVRFLPEFFDSRSHWKNPGIYKYYRNSIVNRYRADASRKISFTDARKTLVGDVGSIRRVFDFLEGWGLINYSPPALNKPLKWEDKESKTGSGASHGGGESGGASSKEVKTKRLCNHCKSACSIACFVCDKNGMTLCARCYVRGNYQIGDVTSSDFRRVEINDDSKADWQERDTQHLLEALMHYGDDWRKVARHVGRTEKECVSHFVKLPFGEEFSCFVDSENVNGSYDVGMDHGSVESCETSLTKRMRLTPLADASNPIMAQAAFLSALAGVGVAEAAARAAVTALSEAEYGSVGESTGSHLQKGRQKEAVVASNGNTHSNTAEGAWEDAKLQLVWEEQDVERAISGIVEVQMKEVKDKIDRFEALDLHMEKEWQQLEQMKNMLFVDQLTLLFHKNPAQKTGERLENSLQSARWGEAGPSSLVVKTPKKIPS
ncbi:SWI/SNF complex subunit SWI3B [Morus notabilis]|uniref:SWI/SNF complex subunit SWI3B n=1 Tax=Morus notabilis TaxID=981085 RepID=UPI000CED4CCC|nr:SWI/SNF complex subunit SWI3B [Morus notabilis]